jgi:6-phosphogluconolactonase
MSDEGMARKSLLSAIKAPEERIHSWHAGKGTPVERAAEYDRVLTEYFEKESRTPDVAIMGMGPDGHTVSLFPGAFIVLSKDPAEEIPVSKDVLKLNKNAVAVRKPDEDEWRLTLTPKILNSAETMIYLIHGSEKRDAFRRLEKNDETLPASWLKGKETFYFITESLLQI